MPVLLWVSVATSKAEISGLFVSHLQSDRIFSLKVVQNYVTGISKYSQKKEPAISADYQKLFHFGRMSNIGNTHPPKYFFVEIM